MTRLVCLPLDDRPVNYDYPRELAALAGFEINLPDREGLGNPWRPSRHADLVHWLEDAARQADALLVAVDTLGYGGLIPSRTSRETAEQVLQRLSILKTIKAAHPDLVILAYSVILRISRADSSEEEKDYWALYGRRMFRLSYLEHKSRLGQAASEEMEECRLLRSQIPDDIYEDYLEGRARNHQVNRTMLDWLAEGVFDYLILPQDDTADYGWNIAEARRLQAAIRQKGLADRGITYPGADETGSLLLARYACRRTGLAPKVWPRYSSELSQKVITAYEDRPMPEMLKAHLGPLGGSIAASPEQADLLLFINAPAVGQGAAELQSVIAKEMDQPGVAGSFSADEYYRATHAEMTTPQRNIEEFVRAMQRALETRSSVALSDVAFVNGADLFLLRQLMASGVATKLSAYAGWNTAGNTLGTVLAHAAINLVRQPEPESRPREAAHWAFLFRRYLDDYFYQSLVRTELAYRELPALGIRPGMERLPADKLPQVESRLTAMLSISIEELRQQFIRAGVVRDVHVKNIHLPWQRLFEIGFDIRVEPL